MSTLAVVSSRNADEDWVFQAIDGALVVVDAAPLADVIVVSDDTLAHVIELLPPSASLCVIGDPAKPPPRAAFVITRAWQASALRELLVALGRGAPRPAPHVLPPASPGEARDAQRAIAAARKLGATTDLVTCETVAVETLLDLLEADRAYCLFHDPETGAIWSESRLARGADDRRAVTGLAGFAARTGRPAVAEAVGEDPRFDGAIDDPHAAPGDRVIAQPVHGSDGLVHAVLVCSRLAKRTPFGADAALALQRFALLVTPVLDQLSIHLHAQQILDDATSTGDDGLFRREALVQQAAPRWGDVIRVSPGWLPWAYWLLVMLLVGSAAFVVFGTVSTYSAGPAVIRSAARTAVTTRIAGNVVEVTVAPNDRVTPDTVIARLDDSDQRAAVQRLEREFQTQLRNHMLDPADAAADAALRAVRLELDTARTALGERLIHAGAAGVVGDVRVRTGQHVEPGDTIVSVVDASKGLDVIALLPGEDRPQLAPGMSLQLELAGYRYAYQVVVIDAVSADVIAPNEARRVLGPDIADSIQLTGPVTVVHGRLPSAEFTADGQQYRYHDGMLGTGEVRVRSEPIIYALLPATRRLRR